MTSTTPTPGAAVPDMRGDSQPSSELLALRRALDAARSELKTATKDADAAKQEAKEARRVAKAAQKALNHELAVKTILEAKLEAATQVPLTKNLGTYFKKWVFGRFRRVRPAAQAAEKLLLVVPGANESRQPRAAKFATRQEPTEEFARRACDTSRPKIAEAPNNKSRRALASDFELPDFLPLRASMPRGRIAVVVQVHNPAFWPELRTQFRALPETFDLFAILIAGSSEEAAEDICADYPDAHIIVFPNYVANIVPFALLINSGVLFRYELVWKLQSLPSRSERDHRCESAEVEARHTLGQIIGAFTSDHDLGLVLTGLEPDQAASASELLVIREYCRRLGISEGLHRRQEVYAGASSYWVRPFLLRMIAALKLSPDEFGDPSIGEAASSAIDRLLGVISFHAGMRVVKADAIKDSRNCPSSLTHVHMIAFYLPQFHPIPENDLWWGEGFTEWTSVTQARPQFSGHRQPRLPSELGFTDLRLAEVREAQAALAKRYGLSAFCYHYYWFDGQPLLRRPLDEVLASGKPDFPFLLCWANEPWTRGWDGKARSILMAQEYRPGWEVALARDIAPALSDPRYFRFLGNPVFLVYRPMDIPDPLSAFRELRRALAELGLPPIHLAGTWPSFSGDQRLPDDPAAIGLDGYVEFRPRGLGSECRKQLDGQAQFAGNVYDYDAIIEKALAQLNEPCTGTRHRGVVMGWDNTPRRGAHSTVLHGANPANFRRWLRAVVKHEKDSPGSSERLVFINAWNEWGEGTYLEPDQEFGRGWLEAVAASIGDGRSN
jgi:lipopolysaccharide biosynthesis protein